MLNNLFYYHDYTSFCIVYLGLAVFLDLYYCLFTIFFLLVQLFSTIVAETFSNKIDTNHSYVFYVLISCDPSGWPSLIDIQMSHMHIATSKGTFGSFNALMDFCLFCVIFIGRIHIEYLRVKNTGKFVSLEFTYGSLFFQ